MQKILIVDDRISDINKLKEQIEKYAKEHCFQFEITARSQENDILKTIEDTSNYDFLFLDIFVDKLNGIDLARKVRERNKTSKIVFFSTTKDAALDAFSVNATQYLVKPVEYKDLENAMDTLIESVNDVKRSVSITTTTGVCSVRLVDIIYIETDQHYQIIYTKEKSTLRTRMNSSEMFRFLNDDIDFIRVGSSYIVNIKYILNFNAKEMFIKNASGTASTISIPRGLYADIKQKYIEYYQKG